MNMNSREMVIAQARLIGLCRNPNAPQHILQLALSRGNELAKQAAVLNRQASEEVLLKAANDGNFKVRLEILERTDIPDSVWDVLAKDKNKYVQEKLVGSPVCPPHILTKVSKRKATLPGVAAHQNAPVELIEKLAKDKLGIVNDLTKSDKHDDAIAVLEGIAQNPNTPTDIVEMLVRHQSSNIRSSVAAYRTDGLAEILVQDQNEGVRAALANNYHIKPEIAAMLAKDESNWVRARIKYNPNTPPSSLRDLADHYDEYAASNPNSPEDLLDSIFEKFPDVDWVWVLAKNTGCSGSLLHKIALQSEQCKLHIASNPSTEPETLRLLFDYKDVHLSSYILRNPSFPDADFYGVWERLTVENAIENSAEDYLELLEVFAKSSRSTQEMLNGFSKIIVKDGPMRLRILHRALIKNLETPSEIVEKICISDELDTWALGHKNISKEFLGKHVRIVEESFGLPRDDSE